MIHTVRWVLENKQEAIIYMVEEKCSSPLPPSLSFPLPAFPLPLPTKIWCPSYRNSYADGFRYLPYGSLCWMLLGG